MKKPTILMAALLPAITFLGACDNSDSPSGPPGTSRVSVQFNAVAPSASASVSSGANASVNASSGASNALAATGPITLTGTNGTLVIDDLQLIVSRLRLKRAEGDCASADTSSACVKFKGGPFRVNLLDGTAAAVVTADVPAGNYTAFEFKSTNLDPHDDAELEEDGIVKEVELLIVDVRKTYANYPRSASMVAHGTFTTPAGETKTFTVYFEAEIKIQKTFTTPFKVPEDTKVVIDIDVSTWFKQGANVMNLAAQDGKTLEFELQFENGIQVGKGDS